jgi:hypothetical protein
MPLGRNRALKAREASATFCSLRPARKIGHLGGAPSLNGPPVPDLFDVITYFRARGNSFTLIASIGFWVGNEKKALTARGLKLWYEAELERRLAARATIR